MALITANVNTCEEAHHLRECVESVRQLADEVVVCDMHSTDGSADLARELGCKVIVHERMPAAEPGARIAAVEASTGEWILVFDPDMRLPAETAAEMRRLIAGDAYDVIEFTCEALCFGRRCTHGHASTSKYLPKLFRKSVFRPNRESRDSHTFFDESLSGRTYRLDRRLYILHLAYEDVDSFQEQHLRYARNEARRLMERGVRPSLWRMFWRPFKRFVGNLVVRSAWLDGVQGLLLAVLVSFYIFQTEALLWELGLKRREEKAGP